MRTIRRFCAAVAMAAVGAGVAANCALPPYSHDTGGDSSASGGGAPGTTSAQATSATSSSGAGQGGAGGSFSNVTASSTTGSTSVAASSGSGMDGGNCNADEWAMCPAIAAHCDCLGQTCYVGVCGPNPEQVDVLKCDGQNWGPPAQPMAPASCCPMLLEPCRPGTVCVITKINGMKTPACVKIPCLAQNQDMPCMCGQILCKNPIALTCTPLNPGAVQCGP